MTCPTIYLDMDGVVVQHFAAIFRLFGRELVESEWPQGKTLSKEVLEIPSEEFNRKILAAGEDFWADMEPFPCHQELWDGLLKMGEVYYLSSPDYGPGCVAGKVRWMEKQHGKGFNRYILTQHKTKLANPHAILIDDGPKNVEAFIAAGGHALLFERPWNGFPHSTEPHKKILAQLADTLI